MKIGNINVRKIIALGALTFGMMGIVHFVEESMIKTKEEKDIMKDTVEITDILLACPDDEDLEFVEYGIDIEEWNYDAKTDIWYQDTLDENTSEVNRWMQTSFIALSTKTKYGEDIIKDVISVSNRKTPDYNPYTRYNNCGYEEWIYNEQDNLWYLEQKDTEYDMKNSKKLVLK